MFVRRKLVVPVVMAMLVPAGLTAAPAVAQSRPGVPAPTPNPWQMRHWPRTQPWQEGQRLRTYAVGAPKPIDPQNYEVPDTMTWDDYKKVPGTRWNDPAVKGSLKNFRGALVLVDYANQPFAVT